MAVFKMKTVNNKKISRMRKTFLFCVLSLLIVTALPLIPYAINVYAEDLKAGESGTEANKVVALQNPAIDLWNEVRQRNTETQGSSQVKSVDSGILINKTGEDWRRFRMEMLVPYGAYFIAAILSAIILFYLLHGKTLLPDGRSGKRFLRFTLNQRTAHWFTVGIFWLLGYHRFNFTVWPIRSYTVVRC